MSQIVGVQATTNVLLGQRYQSVSNEVRSYFKGEYGKAPGEVNAELVKTVLGDEKPISKRFADTLEPGFEKAKERSARWLRMMRMSCPILSSPIAEKFFQEREERAALKVSYTIKKL